MPIPYLENLSIYVNFITNNELITAYFNTLLNLQNHCIMFYTTSTLNYNLATQQFVTPLSRCKRFYAILYNQKQLRLLEDNVMFYASNISLFHCQRLTGNVCLFAHFTNKVALTG
jgi:hypothetical protein